MAIASAVVVSRQVARPTLVNLPFPLLQTGRSERDAPKHTRGREPPIGRSCRRVCAMIVERCC